MIAHTADRRLWLVIANYIVVAQGAITGPFVARLLGPAGRGQSATIQSVVYITFALASLGIVSALNGRSSRFEWQSIWVGSKRARVIITIVSLLVTPLSFLAALAVGLKEAWVILLVAMLAAFGNAICSSKIGLFLASGFYKRLLVGRLISALSLITGLICAALVAKNVLVITTIYIITSLGVAVVPLPKKHRNSTTEHATEVGELLRRDMPGLAASSFLNVSNARIDQTYLPAVMNNANLGFYSVGVTYGSLVAPLGSAIASISMTHAAKTGSERRQPLLKLLALPAAVSVALGILADVLIPAVFGSSFSAAVTPALILCLGGFLISAIAITGGQLTSLGATRSLIPGEIVAFLTLPLAFPLASRWGPTGAAIASCICYTCNLTVLLSLRRKHLNAKDVE